MKKLILILFIAACATACGTDSITTPEVKAGQTWLQPNEDPFRNVQYDTIKILEVRGEYAKVLWGKTYETSTKKKVVSCCGAILMK